MSFDILSRETKVLGPRFLEASAGTGKTFTIEHLVVRLLLEGIPIDRILVVTFTRAATRELKLRIRSNIRTALESLKNDASDWDYLNAVADREKSTLLLEEALLWFDQAQIFTIHSFCHRMLSELSFEAGLGIGLSDPDDSTYKAALKQSVLDTLRTDLSSEEFSPGQLNALLKRFPFETLVQKLMQLSEGEASIASYPTFEESKALYESRLASLNLDQLEEAYAEYAPCYKRMLPYVSLGDFERLLEEKELFLERMAPENQKVRAKLPSGENPFDRLCEELLPILMGAREPLHTLFRIARLCREKARHLLEEDLPPDELLSKMLTALEKPAFLGGVQKRYEAAIIDEFQDTDPKQWKIFSKLFLSAKALALVGDPKQSIYRFRHADIQTYREAQECLGSECRGVLNTNFRSDPSLVEALNVLFSEEVSGDWLRFGEPFESVKPAPKAVDRTFNDERGSVHFFKVEGKQGRSKKWPTEEIEQECLFSFIAHEVLALDVPLSDIAVLVRDRFQAKRLQSYLERCGIPAKEKRGGNLVETVAFSEVHAFLDALLHRGDLGKFKRLLAGPLVGWTAQEIDGDSLIEARTKFSHFMELFHERGFACCFNAFLSSEWGSEALLARGELETLADVQQVADLIIEEESFRGASGHELLHFLENLKSANPDEMSTLKRKGVEDDERVQIMTIHVSKGLEFEVVFALGLGSRQTKAQEIIRTRDNFLEVADKMSSSTQLVIEEEDAEKLRQLYVAMTRAKRRLYVPLLKNQDKDPKLGLASPMDLFTSNWNEGTLEQVSKRCSVTVEEVQPSDPPSHHLARKQRHFACPPKIEIHQERVLLSSFSSLANSLPQESVEIEETMLPPGAETGIILHRILEECLKPGALQEEIVARELFFSSLKGWEEAVNQMITKALSLPLLSDGEFFTLNDVPRERMYHEMEFLFSQDSSAIKGFVDLFFEYKDKFYLLDWKSNVLPAYDRVYLEEAMKHHDYFLQADLYAEALKRYLALFDERPFDEIFGGAYYLFLRGPAAYTYMPKEVTIGFRI